LKNFDVEIMVQTNRCILQAYNAEKCDCSQGSALDPTGEAYSAAPETLAGFKG